MSADIDTIPQIILCLRLLRQFSGASGASSETFSPFGLLTVTTTEFP